MTAHAYLPPSSASTWSKCAMWAAMNARYPGEPDGGPEAQEGTAAHWVVAEILAGRPCDAGMPTPNGLIVTEEMLDGAEVFIDTVHKRTHWNSELHVEERLPIPFLRDDCFGTPDVWAVSSDRKFVEIVDYKYGHRYVDEFWNAQGLCYFAGILDKLATEWGMGPGMLDQYLTVSFTIVQPRCYYKGEAVRTHTFPATESRVHLNQLAVAAEAATLPEPAATTNVGCQCCPGRHACSALQQAAYSDAELSNTRAPLDLSPEAAGLELRMLERALARLEARVDGLREITLANLKAGKRVPFYHVEQGRGRAQWALPDGQIIAMGEMFGKNLSKPGVVTPSQAKKLGVSEEIVQAYSVTPATSLKLIADNPADVRKVFG